MKICAGLLSWPLLAFLASWQLIHGDVLEKTLVWGFPSGVFGKREVHLIGVRWSLYEDRAKSDDLNIEFT
jgi:hypothetical protein